MFAPYASLIFSAPLCPVNGSTGLPPPGIYDFRHDEEPQTRVLMRVLSQFLDESIIADDKVGLGFSLPALR